MPGTYAFPFPHSAVRGGLGIISLFPPPLPKPESITTEGMLCQPRQLMGWAGVIGAGAWVMEGCWGWCCTLESLGYRPHPGRGVISLKG